MKDNSYLMLNLYFFALTTKEIIYINLLILILLLNFNFITI